MELKKMKKQDLEKAIKLYVEERDSFEWLISFEEFVKDYVVKCEQCFELFVLDDGDDSKTLCEDCENELNREVEEDDFETGYFESHKEYYLHGIDY